MPSVIEMLGFQPDEKNLGKTLAAMPATIATLPLDILANPGQFTNAAGKFDVGTLFSLNRRKQNEVDRASVQAADRIKQYADIWDTISKAATPESQDALVRGFTGLGADREALDPFNIAAHTDRGAARSAAREAGVSAAGVNIADVDAARDAVQTTHSATQQKGVYTHGSGLSADNIRLREDLIRNRPKSAAAEKETPEDTATRRRDERAATRIFDKTADRIESGSPMLIDTVQDPTLRAQLQEGLPAFAAEEGQRAAEDYMKARKKAFAKGKKRALRAIDENVRPLSRKAIATRKAAKEAIGAAQMPQDVGADSPIINEAALPTDPAERIAAAEELGKQLLAAGFPPEKAAAELLRRGFRPEELPE